MRRWEKRGGYRTWVLQKCNWMRGNMLRSVFKFTDKKMEIGRLRGWKRARDGDKYRRERHSLFGGGEREFKTGKREWHLYQAEGEESALKRSLSLVLCLTTERGEYICSSVTVLPSGETNGFLSIDVTRGVHFGKYNKSTSSIILIIFRLCSTFSKRCTCFIKLVNMFLHLHVFKYIWVFIFA